MKVTDSKLYPIDYGADSIQYWINKAPQGDAKRAASLLRDLGKLQARFDRVTPSESVQYNYVRNRLAELRADIERKSGTVESKGSAKPAPTTNVPVASNPIPALTSVARMVASLEQDVERYRDNHKQRSRMRSDVTTLKQRLARIPGSRPSSARDHHCNGWNVSRGCLSPTAVRST